MGLSVQRGVGRNGGRRRHRRSRVNSEINVTPLVDVMLVLLIVFMVAAPLLSVGVPIDLPKTDAKALPSQNEPLTISVDEEGRVFLQDEEVLMDDLIAKLVAVSDTGYDERIFLRGDENSDYGAVMKVMARINAAGFSNLNLVTDPVNQ
jgi:biopolymer transport protein TolR